MVELFCNLQLTPKGSPSQREAFGLGQLIINLYIMTNMEYKKEENEIKTDKQPDQVKLKHKRTKKEKENLKMFLFGLLGLVVLFVIIAGGVGIYRTYAKVANDNFTLTVSKILRLPAFKVDGKTVLYTDYVNDLKALEHLQSYEKKTGNTTVVLSKQEMSDQVLWRLFNNILLQKAANTYSVKVEKEDVDTIKSQVLQQFKDTATAEKELKDRYGWDMKTYEEKVIHSYVLQNKLNEKVQADKKLDTEIYNSALKVLNELKNGTDFATTAKKYGQDGTASNGGDLGWFGKGAMVAEFENAAFALKKGELSQSLVQTQFGYHIIKVEDTKKVKEKDENGKEVEVDQVKARHILFRLADAGWYLDRAAKQAKIHLYLKVNNPFDKPNI